MKKKKAIYHNIKLYTTTNFELTKNENSPKILPTVLPYENTYKPSSVSKRKFKKPKRPKKSSRISLGSESAKNIINIVNNMNDDKNKKIDLKMNINRYNIKYYVSNDNVFPDNFSDQDIKYERVFSAKQLRSDSYVNHKLKKFNTSRLSSKRHHMNSLIAVFPDKTNSDISSKLQLNLSPTETNDNVINISHLTHSKKDIKIDDSKKQQSVLFPKEISFGMDSNSKKESFPLVDAKPSTESVSKKEEDFIIKKKEPGFILKKKQEIVLHRRVESCFERPLSKSIIQSNQNSKKQLKIKIKNSNIEDNDSLSNLIISPKHSITEQKSIKKTEEKKKDNNLILEQKKDKLLIRKIIPDNNNISIRKLSSKKNIIAVKNEPVVNNETIKKENVVIKKEEVKENEKEVNISFDTKAADSLNKSMEKMHRKAESQKPLNISIDISKDKIINKQKEKQEDEPTSISFFDKKSRTNAFNTNAEESDSEQASENFSFLTNNRKKKNTLISNNLSSKKRNSITLTEPKSQLDIPSNPRKFKLQRKLTSSAMRSINGKFGTLRINQKTPHTLNINTQDSLLEASISQVEAENLLESIFENIKLADDDDRKLNRSFSFDEIDFVSDKYQKYKKEMITREEKKINGKILSITSLQKGRYKSFLDSALVAIKQNTVYKTIVGKLKQNFIMFNTIDSDRQQKETEITQMQNFFKQKLLFYDKTRSIVINGKIKDMLMTRYLEISGELQRNFLNTNDYQVGRCRLVSGKRKGKPQRKKLYISKSITKDMSKALTMAKDRDPLKSFHTLLTENKKKQIEELFKKASDKSENTIYVQDFISKDTTYLIFSLQHQFNVVVPPLFLQNCDKSRSISFLESMTIDHGVTKTRSFDKILRNDSQNISSTTTKHVNNSNLKRRKSVQHQNNQSLLNVDLLRKLTFKNEDNSFHQMNTNAAKTVPLITLNGIAMESGAKSPTKQNRIKKKPSRNELVFSILPKKSNAFNNSNTVLLKDSIINKQIKKGKRIIRTRVFDSMENEKPIANETNFFSTLNKDITLIQTNKIKSNYLESLGNDMYQKIFFYIEEHNISFIKQSIDDNIANININHQDSKGNTFLNYAVRFNFDEIVEFLLRLGCNPNIGNVSTLI